jgi:uncharacterized protein (TIGR03067 family)
MKGITSQSRQGIASPLNVDGKIIGGVHEGDDQAYVVVRTRRKFDRAELTKVEVIALKRSGAQWKMVLPDLVRIMAETSGRTGQNTQTSGPVKDRADPEGIPTGTWAVLSSDVHGKPSEYPPKASLFTFADGKVTVGPKKQQGKLFATFKADPKKDPKEIDLVQMMDKRKIVMHGIYRLEKDRLIIYLGTASGSSDDAVLEGKRPTEFKPGPNIQFVTFQRAQE